MISRHKNFLFLGLLCITILLAIWSLFELSADDVKGQENPVKKAYFTIARILPIKPAVKLKVTYHHQEHKLSCEVASLLMALQYKGVKATETELIQQLPLSDPGPRQADNTWGNPNLGFVGNIDGTMPNTGYGVYEQPIYDLAAKYRSAKIINNASLTDLTDELINGNPIVVWGIIGTDKDISWKTPDGTIIKAKLDEHARTLIGYTGESNNPRKMILLDPIYGEIRMSTANFIKNWTALDNKAVVIY